MTEDEELALALAMSVEGSEPAAAPNTAPAEPEAVAAQSAAAAGASDAAPMPDVSKEENTFAAANGAKQVKSHVSVCGRMVLLLDCHVFSGLLQALQTTLPACIWADRACGMLLTLYLLFT